MYKYRLQEFRPEASYNYTFPAWHLTLKCSG
jgi:hypothetical protein